jgi:hypothetical protein
MSFSTAFVDIPVMSPFCNFVLFFTFQFLMIFNFYINKYPHITFSNIFRDPPKIGSRLTSLGNAVLETIRMFYSSLNSAFPVIFPVPFIQEELKIYTSLLNEADRLIKPPCRQFLSSIDSPPAVHPFNLPANQLAKQPINNLANQTIGQPTSHPGSQSTSQ